jgi:hypothetical protein
LWICVEGAGAIGGERVVQGDVWLLPESGDQPAISGDGLMAGACESVQQQDSTLAKRVTVPAGD